MNDKGTVRLAGAELDSSRHVCAFFNSQDEHYKVLLPFIKDGFAAGDKAFHIVDPALRQDHLRRLAQAGINVDPAQASGQLEVRRWEEVHLREGCFYQNAMLALIQEVLRAGKAQDYRLTRFVANMEWALEDCPGVGDIVEYESRLNYVLPQYDDVVICTYDCAKFGADVVVDILRTHPMVIIGGTLQKNPFYVPPDEFLSELRSRAGQGGGVELNGPALRRKLTFMDSSGSLPDEIQSLRRCLRDLVALSALPAVWTGREPRAIADGLADMLLSILWLDLVYVSVRGPAGELVAEVARARKPFTADQACQTGRALLQSVDHDRPDSVVLVPDPTSGDGHPPGVLHVAALPIGHNAEWGQVVAGSRRADFPTDIDRLLVRVGANHALISLQEASLLATVRRSDEQKAELLAREQAARAEAQRLNAELEERVAQRTAELQQANIQLEKSQEDLRRLSSHQHAAREEERTRIAREIHDVLGGALTGLKMDVAAASKRVDGDRAALLTRLQAMLAQIDDTIQTVRRIATDLRPGILDDFGLAAAIEWQMQDFQARAGIHCHLVLKVDEIALPPDQATAIFRIYQETLTNVARHANATQVTIRLEEEAGTLVLQVRDNGRGITPQELMGGTSLGLLGMRERVRLLNGELNVGGAPGQGTSVVVRIPLPPAQERIVQLAPEAAHTGYQPGAA